MTPGTDRLALWRRDYVQAVRDLFGVEPDDWQRDALILAPITPRLAMKACKGPGKTACLAWIGLIFLLTHEDAKIHCTAITGDNLSANLWPELARWYQACPLLQATFEFTKSAIYKRPSPSHPASAETWHIRARTWPRDADATMIGKALAGLHGPYVMWLLDESGDMPIAIGPVCEAIFAGEPKEAHIVQAGNPSALDGLLYHACVLSSGLWKMVEITGDPDDPKRSPRISIEHAREMIRQYGRDNPWVMVDILGKFPSTAFNALIGIDEVNAAMKRSYREWDYDTAPKIIGVDVARYGDDQSVVVRRQGLQMFTPRKHRNLTSTQGAGIVSREWEDFSAQACFIDATGGDGWAWIDRLVEIGRAPQSVQFAGEAHEAERYYNKRAEMAFDFVQWIKRGGALPDDDRLRQALTRTTYSFKGGRMLLEPKEALKDKLGWSPDEFDACIVTFAEPVTAVQMRVQPRREAPVYKPFAELDAQSPTDYPRESGFDPYRR